ncbi:MAG: radical SAM protein [Treponema sp.]|jgi:radical SAM superfamily enzyme YgiQ (UPF0313 family)|nr:radical SAM protein [Treponema sp.]
MKIILVQPPFVQLNSAYPSIYYLSSFLEKRGFEVLARDHSIGLFERIFSPEGLRRIFTDAREVISELEDEGIRHKAEEFLSREDHWAGCIEQLLSFLRGKNREWGHLLTLTNGVLPMGNRTVQILLDRDAGYYHLDADSGPRLASAMLEDLVEFITAFLDPGFNLIRYLQSPSPLGFRDFRKVKENLEGYILKTFYEPWLEEEWNVLDRGEASLFLGLTIPFPGCLPAALTCAHSARRRFADRLTVAAGGGYVNTELRFMKEPDFFDYVDYLCFDRGYGSFAAVLDGQTRANLKHSAGQETRFSAASIYKTIFRDERGKLINGINTVSAEYEKIEDEAVSGNFPDYSSLDFSRYLCIVDSENPMHRLWSDGRWLKVYLAHGCYWHKCTFCDTTLDYISSYIPVDIPRLFEHLCEQAKKTGVRGVHLVDETAPHPALMKLACLNRDAGRPLIFWGNIRFEKSFTRDAAAILADGGLIGVSGGIEVATENGLKRLCKGFTLEDLIQSLASFREAGILCHGYLIYGYWDQDEQEIHDCAEIVWQLFGEKLLDSAFWHKFILTRHSGLYEEWKRKKHPELKVLDDVDTSDKRNRIFALNDLSFAGEAAFDRYTEALDGHLHGWLSGFSHRNIADYPAHFWKTSPSVSKSLVKFYLRKGEEKEKILRSAPPADGNSTERLLFLGSRPFIEGAAGNLSLNWNWRFRDYKFHVPEKGGNFVSRGEPLPPCSPAEDTRSTDFPGLAEELRDLLMESSGGEGMEAAAFYKKFTGLLREEEAGKAWTLLRNHGLALYRQ